MMLGSAGIGVHPSARDSIPHVARHDSTQFVLVLELSMALVLITLYHWCTSWPIPYHRWQ